VLHLADKIRGAAIRAVDGDIGTLEDFYFEEDRWTVRYFLVDTGKWFSGKRVLVSPMSVKGPWTRAEIPVSLTKSQVWNSPQVDWQRPLSRGTEAEVLKYYGYPWYWTGGGLWGSFENPAALVAQPPPSPQPDGPVVDVEKQHLRSTSQSTGYHIHATDGEVGHVDDFLIGEESWRIRYLLVDTSNWIGGRSVIIGTDAVDGIDRERGMLHVHVTRDEIKGSRPFASIEEAVGAAEVGPPFVLI
jgi:hypothetical protein